MHNATYIGTSVRSSSSRRWFIVDPFFLSINILLWIVVDLFVDPFGYVCGSLWILLWIHVNLFWIFLWILVDSCGGSLWIHFWILMNTLMDLCGSLFESCWIQVIVLCGSVFESLCICLWILVDLFVDDSESVCGSQWI